MPAAVLWVVGIEIVSATGSSGLISIKLPPMGRSARFVLVGSLLELVIGTVAMSRLSAKG